MHSLIPTLELIRKRHNPGYVPKLPLPGKFYSKYIVHVMYTIAYRMKSSSEKTFWNVWNSDKMQKR